MAVDKRVAERRLQKLLKAVSWHRSAQEAYRHEGAAAGVERCERLLEIDYAHIRSHCTEHGLELPHDVPPESAE